MPAAPRLIFCLPTPRLVHQASLDLQLQRLPPQSPSKQSQGPQNVLSPRQGRALNLPGYHIGHANPDEQVRKAANNLSQSRNQPDKLTLYSTPETDSPKSRNNQAHPPQCSHPDPSPPSSPRQPASNPREHSVPASPRQPQPQPPPPSHPCPHSSPRRLPRSPARSPQVPP